MTTARTEWECPTCGGTVHKGDSLASRKVDGLPRWHHAECVGAPPDPVGDHFRAIEDRRIAAKPFIAVDRSSVLTEWTPEQRQAMAADNARREAEQRKRSRAQYFAAKASGQWVPGATSSRPTQRTSQDDSHSNRVVQG